MAPKVLIEAMVLETPLFIEAVHLLLLLIRIFFIILLVHFNNMDSPLLALEKIFRDLILDLSELSHHFPELSQLLRIIP